MTKNVTLSIVVLAPLVGIGGVFGSSMGSQEKRVEPNLTDTIQPLEMHQAAGFSKLQDQQIEVLF